MTHVTNISVQHVRNHTKKSIELSPETTIITGKNGAGKTSLLEALYIALQGTSFRGSDSDILQKDQAWYRIDIEMSDGSKRTVKFDSSKQAGRKQFIVNDKTSYRLPSAQKYPLVLFEPDDLRLIDGSPTRRRQFIDKLIGQLDPAYVQAVRKYERALRQRNNLLKRAQTTPDELFVWNVALSEYGSYIISERTVFIEKINKRISDVYNSLARSDDVVSIHYSHTFIDDVKQKLLSELTTHSEKDKILGFTSIGPHRHDVIVNYNNTSASATASRGENRSIILSLKLIEIEIIESILEKKPIILLDDVFSELDEFRQENILSLKQNQTIITQAQNNELTILT